jgi:hypothetical protein
MISRGQLSKAKKRAIGFYNQRKLRHCVSKVSRGNVVIDKSLFKKHLEKIEFYCEENGYWAETDGQCIYINAWKPYDDNELFYTLFHEALHGIFRVNNYEMSEYREHEIMKHYDKKLL